MTWLTRLVTLLTGRNGSNVARIVLEFNSVEEFAAFVTIVRGTFDEAQILKTLTEKLSKSTNELEAATLTEANKDNPQSTNAAQ